MCVRMDKEHTTWMEKSGVNVSPLLPLRRNTGSRLAGWAGEGSAALAGKFLSALACKAVGRGSSMHPIPGI